MEMSAELILRLHGSDPSDGMWDLVFGQEAPAPRSNSGGLPSGLKALYKAPLKAIASIRYKLAAAPACIFSALPPSTSATHSPRPCVLPVPLHGILGGLAASSRHPWNCFSICRFLTHTSTQCAQIVQYHVLQ